MADPLLIQRPPTGLLDLLGLKAMGQGPIQLAETVACTLADCVDYYVANRRTSVSGVTGVAMVANTSYTVPAILVPAGEIWFVYGLSINLNVATAAATAIRFWGGYQLAASTNVVTVGDTLTIGASDNGSLGVIFSRPLIWLPGTQGYLITGAVTGVPNAAGRMTLDVARLTL